MIGTTIHRVANAQRFIDSTEMWAVVGGTAAWADDQNPPAPAVGTVTVATIIGAKLATAKLVIRDDAGGDETFLSSGITTGWRSISDYAEAVSVGARWALVRASIVGLELPLDTFRQVGFYSNLIRDGAVPGSQQNLLPSEVADYGSLELLEYRQPVNRTASGSYELAAIIEF